MNGRVELISQAEYARRRGVAKSAVAKAVKEKRITLIDGMIDPAVADIQWSQNTRARADSGRAGATQSLLNGEGASQPSDAPESPEPGLDPDSYQGLRTRRERAAVEAAERENAKASGQLIDRDSTARGAFDAFRALRDAVMSAPQRAAAKVVGLGDAREIERVFADELRTAFATAEVRLQQLHPNSVGAAAE